MIVCRVIKDTEQNYSRTACLSFGFVLQTFKIDEDVIADCLSLNFSASVPRDQLISLLQRRESHPLRVAYDLILDHKNAKIRIDGTRHSCVSKYRWVRCFRTFGNIRRLYLDLLAFFCRVTRCEDC